MINLLLASAAGVVIADLGVKGADHLLGKTKKAKKAAKKAKQKVSKDAEKLIRKSIRKEVESYGEGVGKAMDKVLEKVLESANKGAEEMSHNLVGINESIRSVEARLDALDHKVDTGFSECRRRDSILMESLRQSDTNFKDAFAGLLANEDNHSEIERSLYLFDREEAATNGNGKANGKKEKATA